MFFDFFTAIVFKIFYFIIRLDLFALMGLALSLVLFLTPWKRLAKKLCIISSVVLVIIGGTPLSHMMISLLENRFPIPELPESIDGIILLGGNFSLAESAERGSPVHNLAGSRIYETIPLLKKYPQARFLFTGTPIEAKLTKEVLEKHGIDTSRAHFENGSVITRDNAKNLASVAGFKAGEKWFLVTSAFHMPRSVGLFRGQGWDVTPYPVDFHTSGDCWKSAYFFAEDHLSWIAWAVAMKEFAGFVNNYIEGKSPEFFPKPK